MRVTDSQRVVAKLIDPATGGLVDTVVFQATAVAGAAKTVIAYQGSGQTGTTGHALHDSLYVLVWDANNNPVRDVTVTFAVTSGGGSVSPATAIARPDGRAATAWTLGAYGEPQQVTASVAGAQSGSFSAVAQQVQEGTSVSLGSRPFGLAVSAADVVLVSQLDNMTVTRYQGTSTTVVTAIQVQSAPVDVAFNATGNRAYVAHQYAGTIGVINTTNNKVEDTITVNGGAFRELPSPDDTKLYVATNANKAIAYDIATGTEIAHHDFGTTPNGLALNSDGSRLYVSTHSGGTIEELKTSDMTGLRTFSPGGTVQEVLLSPDGTELYTVDETSSRFLVYDLATGDQVASVSLGNGAGGFGAAMTPSPDRSKIYVTLTFAGDVKVVDRLTRTVVRTIHVGGAPRRIGFTSDGTAVIANESGYVTWVK